MVRELKIFFRVQEMKEFYLDLETFQALHCDLIGFLSFKRKTANLSKLSVFKSDKFKLNGWISRKDDCE